MVNQLMKNAVFAAAHKLLNANNTVTTLEIKTELRTSDPEFYWTQAKVSTLMDEFEQEGKFTYTDNGVYRIYSQPAPAQSTLQVTVGNGLTANTSGNSVTGVQPSQTKKSVKSPSNVKVSRISKTKALNLLQNSKGHFFKVVFIKKEDGTERTINGQYVKGQIISSLGIVRVKESSLLKQLKKDGNLDNIPSKSVIRSFNINNLKSLGIGGKTYKIRN